MKIGQNYVVKQDISRDLNFIGTFNGMTDDKYYHFEPVKFDDNSLNHIHRQFISPSSIESINPTNEKINKTKMLSQLNRGDTFFVKNGTVKCRLLNMDNVGFVLCGNKVYGAVDDDFNLRLWSFDCEVETPPY